MKRYLCYRGERLYICPDGSDEASSASGFLSLSDKYSLPGMRDLHIYTMDALDVDLTFPAKMTGLESKVDLGLTIRAAGQIDTLSFPSAFTRTKDTVLYADNIVFT